MKLTNVRLQEIIDVAFTNVDYGEALEMARELLAVRAAQENPVAFYANGAYYNTERAALKDGAEDFMQLFTAPPAQPVALPDDRLYKLANHIAGAKGGLPDEWQDWAEEIESDIRSIAADPAPEQ